MQFGGAPLKNLFGPIVRSPGPKWFFAEMTRNWCCSAVRCGAVTAFISTYDRKSVEIKMSVGCSKSLTEEHAGSRGEHD